MQAIPYQGATWTGFILSTSSNTPTPELLALEDKLLDADYLIAYRSHRTGDFLCGDCASNEDAEFGSDHDWLALSSERENSGCDQCGSRDFD